MRLEEAQEDRRRSALDRARGLMRRIEARDRPRCHRSVALGWEEPDAALGGGLGLGALHEVGGRAATGFAIRLLGRLKGAVLWCHPAGQKTTLYGPGLVQVGQGDLPDRLIIARARNGSEGCWIAEEALRSGAFTAVVLQPADPVGLIPSRRLHLAAGRGGALGLIQREVQGHGPVLAPGIAASRWQVDPIPSIRQGAMIDPHWRLVLQRQRGGSADRIGEEGCWSVPA